MDRRTRNAHLIRRVFFPLIACLLVLLAGACARRHQYTGLVFDEPTAAAAIEGIGLTGEPFSLREYEGELALIFFGYTYCPDICPMTLQEMAQAYQQIEEEAPRLVEDLNVVFVTVDPERDTPERLAEYVPLFDPDFQGVYVPPAELEPIKSAYGVLAEKRVLDEAESAAGYLMDHTTGIYLVDRKGDLRAFFRGDVSAADLAADLKALLRS